MKRSSRLSLVTVLAGALLGSPLATASSGDTATRPDKPQPHARTSRDITLITGDRVNLTTYADGRAAVTVDPAERANGVTPGFHQRQADGHVYVIPADVNQYVPDRLDLALFDVTELARQGYDDVSADAIPVIIDYGKSTPRATEQLPAVTHTRALPAIGAVAADVDKAHADNLAQRMLRGQTARSGPKLPGLTQVDKIWLDRQVTTADEDSAPQIGAPSAWDAGFTGDGITIAILDTGIDSTHPDLAGKVVAEANFSDSPTLTDRFGHGSHVASIAAGTGSASDGLRKGIAYEADLMNGKVLNDFGSGPLSEVIAGMQWAATNGADVINMSLGVQGLYTDGTDPVSQAVDELSEESGALFVIAAGNDGPGDGTVTTPGTASSALTVGAVDKSDALAPYSSRGPRAGDFALKPDLTAPGSDIIAARAADTSIGTPVDEFYTRLSGTSMATPHVAAAAALLLQQRSDLTGPALKALLGSTAVPQDATVYEQGAGRIDLTQAISSTILPSDISLSLGYFPYPQDAATPVTKTLTYRNLGDSDTMLSLDATLADGDGAPPVGGQLSLSTDALAVPAGGSASLDVTVDPQLGTFGLYGGYVNATDPAGVVTRTTVGFYKESERYSVTVHGVARDGRPAAGISSVDLINVDSRELFQGAASFVDGTATFRVPPGNYAAMSYIFTYDEPHVYAMESTAAFEPEVAVTEDTEVTLDASDGIPIEIETKDPTKATHYTLSYYRADAVGSSYSHSFTMSPPIDEAYATPTDSVEVGDFEFYSMWSMPAPDIDVTADGERLRAEYVFNSARLDGHLMTELVYAGLGKPEDFESVDVEGKVALIRRGDITFVEKMHNAEAAGALAVIIFNHSPGLLLISGDPGTVPTLSMTQVDGEALLERMDGEPMPVEIDAVKISPYLYELLFAEPDAIPGSLSYQVGKSNTAKVNVAYRSHVTDHGVGELRHKWRPWEFFSFGFLRQTVAPLNRTEYVSSGDTEWAQYFYGESSASNPFGAPMQDGLGTLDAGDKLRDSWLTQVAVPGLWPASDDPTESTVYRDGETLSMFMPDWGDPEDHWGWLDSTDTASFRLFNDGDLVSETSRPRGDFAVGAGPSVYRLEFDVARAAGWWTMSTATSTAWTVQSAGLPAGQPEVLPLLHVDYRADVDMLNQVRRTFPLTLDVSHQPGAAQAPVAGARLWVSTDDGDSWRELKLRRRGSDQFGTVVQRLDRDADFVSLKIEVWDSAGNRIEQEVTRAYTLR